MTTGGAGQVLRGAEWAELRERLARAAREIHIVAIAGDSTNAPALLAVAENLAGLATTIPDPPPRPDGDRAPPGKPA